MSTVSVNQRHPRPSCNGRELREMFCVATRWLERNATVINAMKILLHNIYFFLFKLNAKKFNFIFETNDTVIHVGINIVNKAFSSLFTPLKFNFLDVRCFFIKF